MKGSGQTREGSGKLREGSGQLREGSEHGREVPLTGIHTQFVPDIAS